MKRFFSFTVWLLIYVSATILTQVDQQQAQGATSGNRPRSTVSQPLTMTGLRTDPVPPQTPTQPEVMSPVKPLTTEPIVMTGLRL